MAKSPTIALVAILIAPECSIHADSTSDRDRLEAVIAAHRAAREAIRTLSCRVELEGAQSLSGREPVDQSCSGRFWISADSMRGKVREAGVELDFLWKDSIRTSVRRAATGKTSLGKRRAPSRHVDRCDPWACGMLVLNLPNTSQNVPLEELVAQSRPKSFRRISRADGDEYLIKLQHGAGKSELPEWDLEIVLNAQQNFLISRRRYSAAIDGKTYVRELRVDSFAEFDDGVFFPTQMTGRSGFDGDWAVNFTVAISDIAVNAPLPPDIFRLDIPPGAVMLDSIRGTSYPVDSSGRPAGRERQMPKGAPTPYLEADGDASFQQTQAEPRPWSRWILPGALVITVIGVALLVALTHRRSGGRVD